jgi:UDP-N-acetylglucosamine--N-acetylmuramyl-(pentapeptide) pyrophosphoryl-undecaprenol N-acetylglucosamine transferase
LKHRIVLTGGGTGGHVYPALSVYEQLKNDPDVEAILYIGAKGHLEERLAAERQIDFVGLNSVGLPRKLSLAMLIWPFKMFGAFSAAVVAFNKFRPTVVLGTGGYASAPPLFAAKAAGYPLAVHEPDAHPGLVNRTLAPYANLCSLGMAGAATKLKCTRGEIAVNGNPIADRFLHPPAQAEARAQFGLRADLQTLLITGGSQGAQAINSTVLSALPQLLALKPEIQVLHQVGEKNFADFERSLKQSGDIDRYVIKPYINDLAVAYAACDLTVCRAGAMTIAELGVSGTPAIFIPFPFAAQNHQAHNARFVESKGAAVVIMQNELTPELLVKTVESLLCDKTRLDGMRQAMRSLGRPDAASQLAKQIKQLSADFLKGFSGGATN